MSENVTRVTGYPAEDFTSQPSFWIDRVHPEDQERVLQELPSLFEQEYYEHEYRWQAADGSYRWFSDVLHVVRAADETPLHIVGVWIDITKRRQAEQSLRDSEEKFRLMTDAIQDVFWMSTPDIDKILYISPTYETHCGVELVKASTSVPSPSWRPFTRRSSPGFTMLFQITPQECGIWSIALSGPWNDSLDSRPWLSD